MYFLKKKTLPLLSVLTLLMLNACSSHHEVIAVSEPHLYNNQYGMLHNNEADAMLRQEVLAMQNQVIEIETEELYLEPGTFLEEDYVQAPEVITYKYKFDPKFYSQASWRKMK